MSEQFNIIKVCAYCKATYGFVLVAYPDSPTKESHGICPDCYPAVMAEAQGIRRES